MSLNLRFIRGAGWDSKVIEFFSRSWCSHVEYITDSGKLTFGAQLKGGVIWRGTDDKIYSGVQKSEVWSIPTTSEQEVKIAEFIHMTLGAPYDWREIVAFGWGEKDWTKPGAFICSRWATQLLEYTDAIDPIPVNEPTSRITPIMVYTLFTALAGVKQVA